jgi:hypothetical protein
MPFSKNYTPHNKTTLDNKLEKFVIQQGECQVFTGSPSADRPMVRDKTGKYKYVTRLVYEAKVGLIPPGMFVCHRCDNPRCVRTDHLFLGTAADNNRDKAEKGRGGCLGEQNYNHKLTERDIPRIRELRNKYGWSQQRIAREMSVSQSAIHCVLAGKTWAKVL